MPSCFSLSEEFPQYVLVNITGALEHFSGVYTLRSTLYRQQPVYQKKTKIQNYNCGCKCRTGLYGEATYFTDEYRDKWCLVDVNHASCSDLIPSQKYPNNPWSMEAVKNPSYGDSICTGETNYPLLYRHREGYWKIENVFMGGQDLSTRSNASNTFNDMVEGWKDINGADVSVTISTCKDKTCSNNFGKFSNPKSRLDTNSTEPKPKPTLHNKQSSSLPATTI